LIIEFLRVGGKARQNKGTICGFGGKVNFPVWNPASVNGGASLDKKRLNKSFS
jgi:hypothetical protein